MSDTETCEMTLVAAFPLITNGFFLIAIDVICYTIVAPLLAIFVGSLILGSLATFDYIFNPSVEAVFVIFLTVLLLNLLFRQTHEAMFLKEFFSGSTGFNTILCFRDGVNVCCIIYFAHRLFTIITAISENQGVSQSGLYQGVPYVFLRKWLNQTTVEESWGYRPTSLAEFQNITSRILEQYVPNFLDPLPDDFKPTPKTGMLLSIWNSITSIWLTKPEGLNHTSTAPEGDDLQRIVLFWKRAVNGADLLLTAAQLTATIAKLLYFHSLFNYMRAMRIMLEMDKKVQRTQSQTQNRVEEEDEDLVDMKVLPPFLRKEQQQQRQEESMAGQGQESPGTSQVSYQYRPKSTASLD